jgi:hypothetical protein
LSESNNELVKGYDFLNKLYQHLIYTSIWLVSFFGLPSLALDFAVVVFSIGLKKKDQMVFFKKIQLLKINSQMRKHLNILHSSLT